MSQKQIRGVKGPAASKENDAAEAPKVRPRRKSRKSEEAQATGQELMRVIGIGASAGGLEALERFFDSTPSDGGAAFVLVQHLSPNFRSMMDELLGRHSRLKFVHVEDGIALEPDTVYLNPPRINLLLEDNRLRFVEIHVGDQPNYPIDKFFESLAVSRGKDAIGVILSGTGSDGARGSNTIIRNGGMVFVQEPSTAKFESMPRSAIDKCQVTGVAAPEVLPLLIQAALNGAPPPPEALEAKLDPDPERGILRLLEKHYGANFGYYKSGMVKRRLNRRAALAGLQDLSQYIEMLLKNPRELERLYCDLLIGVTAFLRDPEAFRSFSLQVVSQLVRRMAAGHQVRIWVPGCASGEEAYSIAILFCEECRKQQAPIDLKIFATDLHHGSLEVASRGVYSDKALAELPGDLRSRYFDELDGRYRAKEILRNLLLFSQHNIIKDPPFSRLDAISCRNLLIYLDDVAQEKVLHLFHFALVRDGYLFLGPSETLGELGPEFETLDNHWRIYRKLRNVALEGSTRLLSNSTASAGTAGPPVISRALLDTPGTALQTTSRPARALRNQRQLLLETYDLILQRYAPPGLLINASGEIVHIFGEITKFLRLKPGAFSGRLADALVEPLVATVDACIDAARRSQASGLIREVAFEFEQGERASVTVKAESMRDARVGGDFVLLTFDEVKPAPSRTLKSRPETTLQLTEKKALRDRVHSLESELRFTEESLQTMIEELETSNEELQSTNEELMSANQELQSTNEELHAVNEELYSVSTEHRRKIDELVEITNDMNNLLRCTDIGTIFLDANRCVRRFTPPALRAFELLEQDIGRPIQQVPMRFPSKHLFEDVAHVEKSGEIIERIFKIDGRDMLMRIFPFKVGERTVGTVLTFVDISKINQAAERTLDARNKELAQANESLEQFNYIVSHDLRAPLRTILNSARWIEEDLGESATEEVRGHCQRLITYANRLSDMLTDLMNYSKVANGYEMIETIDFAIMLRAIVEMVDSDGRLSVICEKPPLPFLGRKTPLQLVFRNLLENAVKYSDQTLVKVEITVEDLGSAYRFSVKDDGPGIPERYHQRIFLPFRKLEHADNKPGTGMGLALVKKAVEDNGGQTNVVSNPHERGTTFVFTWAKILLHSGHQLDEEPVLNPD